MAVAVHGASVVAAGDRDADQQGGLAELIDVVVAADAMVAR
jgi:hypothetical protein